MLIALTRGVSPTLGHCELQELARQPIDIAKAIEQHRCYERRLAELGARVLSLPADARFPDAVFVEDPAIVLDEIAVMTRMGAESRRGEGDGIAEALVAFRDLRRIEAPATLEGGDVMRVGKTLYVGLSRRTNSHGIRQLEQFLRPLGYEVIPVPVRGCLHLKSACCYLGSETILSNRAWIDAAALSGFRILDVPAEEPRSANILRVGGTLILPAAFPKTRQLLEDSGFQVCAIDVSELAKAEGGVTCTSILFESEARGA
ncbi:MAG TPA: arginine deiminase family protein [Bryobacteraceae bacterium]|nr:arginine deiminase family protein [Bryobacteraceae bacterium]